ncbi:MAG: hypothetical protein ACI31C_02005 [Muribaculaceae bacterium]
MKKILITLTSLLVCMNAYSMTPSSSRNATEEDAQIVIEGRTWWYTSDYCGYGTTDEYGLRVGEEVEIDGVKWHKVQKILDASYKYRSDVPITFNDDVVDLCYMREEGKNVYTMVPDDMFYWALDFYLYRAYEIIGDVNEPIQVYSFGEVNDQWVMGGDHDFQGSRRKHLTISDITEIESCGNSYSLYTAKCTNDDCLDVTYIKGIGYSNWWSDLFCMPCDDFDLSMPYHVPPMLRYVTEGVDNEIIYEGLGGIKIWDDFLNVSDIAVDGQDSTPRYYNLQGMEVSTPDTPGIYLKKVGGTTTKIVIK